MVRKERLARQELRSEKEGRSEGARRETPVCVVVASLPFFFLLVHFWQCFPSAAPFYSSLLTLFPPSCISSVLILSVLLRVFASSAPSQLWGEQHEQELYTTTHEELSSLSGYVDSGPLFRASVRS